MSQDVSVIVVSWNTRALLRECLASVFDRAGPVRFEVIVVDNGSRDGSPDMVSQEFPRVRLIRNDENRGFAAANNQGIAVAGGRYVLLLNSDTTVLDEAIARAVVFSDEHPDTAVVGCRTFLPSGQLQHNCFQFPSLLNLLLSMSRLARRFPRSRFFGRQRLTWWDYDTPREVDAVAGCFMLVRREAIEDVGPMSESYFMYSEDTDWCWRFRRSGWKVMYTPDATIVHVHRGSSSQSSTGMHVLERRSLLLFLEKRSGRMVRATANLMFLTGSLLRLPVLALRRILGGQAARRQWELSAAALRFHLLGSLPGST
ncbi:MAG: glycosyltransferase family 2 protein [Phycisphaerae bacterium]|nr:glycosyltransferase family 2 protein [Phycisphaerae bacterium]